MKTLLLFTFLLIGTISSHAIIKNDTIEYIQEYSYTTGYHSDGTSASIRYTTDYSGNIDNIEIKYNGYWHTTYVKMDYNYNRRYVKNPANKRYYF